MFECKKCKMALCDSWGAQHRDTKWVDVQQRTLIRWANSYLVEGEKVNDPTDFRDGVAFIRLLSALTFYDIPLPHPKPKNKFHMLANITAGLERVEHHKLFPTISPENFFDEKPDTILYVLHMLCLRCQVSFFHFSFCVSSLFLLLYSFSLFPFIFFFIFVFKIDMSIFFSCFFLFFFLIYFYFFSSMLNFFLASYLLCWWWKISYQRITRRHSTLY